MTNQDASPRDAYRRHLVQDVPVITRHCQTRNTLLSLTSMVPFLCLLLFASPVSASASFIVTSAQSSDPTLTTKMNPVASYGEDVPAGSILAVSSSAPVNGYSTATLRTSDGLPFGNRLSMVMIGSLLFNTQPATSWSGDFTASSVRVKSSSGLYNGDKVAGYDMEWTAPSGSVTVEDLDPEGNVTATLNFPLTLISQGVMIPDKEGSAVVGDIHGGSRVLGPLHSNTVRVSVNLTSGAPATLAVSESGKVESTSAKAFSFHLIQFAPVLTMNPELTPGFYVNGRIPIRSCTIYSDDRVIPAIGCRVTRTFAEADPFDLLPAAPSCTTQLGGSGLLSFGRVTGQDLIAGADASGRVSSLTQQLTLDTRCDSSTAATKTVIRVMGDAVTSQRDSTGTPVFGSSNPGLGYALSVSTNGGAPAALQPNTPVNIATPAANNSHAIAVTPVLLTDKAPPSGTAVSHVTLDIWPGVG